MKPRVVLCLSLVSALVLVGGCKPKPAAAPAGGGGAFAIQVVAAPAALQKVTESLSLVGTLGANESVEIKSETDGVIREIRFQEGDHVKQGQLLVLLDESKLAANVAESEAGFQLSKANHDRAQQLFKDKLISQQEFDQAAATFAVNQATLALKQRELKDTKIFAPFTGVLGVRNVSPGQVISKNTSLTWLTDLDPVKASVNVPERFLSQLKLGQAVEFGVAAFAGRRFRGEIYFIAPFVDEATRTAQVLARIRNADFALKPGMFASLDLTLTTREQAVVIPESAIMLSGDRTSVFIVDDKQMAQIRPVKLGVRQAGMVEIIEGVKPGEIVISEGVQKTRPGGLVKVVAPGGTNAPAGPKP